MAVVGKPPVRLVPRRARFGGCRGTQRSGSQERQHKIVATAGDGMRKRLLATERPEEDARILGEMLAEDLMDWPGDAWLAIDDYHYAAESAAAEEFFESFVMGSGVSILMTSRRKPGWATARRRLYGEITEFDRTLLAMSDHEALEVLANVAPAPNLLRRASGWPAVIGLAALTGGAATPAETLPNMLYTYFAEELYQVASPASRKALSILAVSPRLTRAAADAILDADLAERFSKRHPTLESSQYEAQRSRSIHSCASS